MSRLQALAILTALAAAPLQAQVISGPATALDGRTIDMTGTAIRLAHIDAPETKQSCQRDGAEWACGSEATENLAAIIDNGPVECEIVGNDPSGTPLAICRNEVFDLGREMVRRGLALAEPDAPEEYTAATGIAQGLHYGLWAAAFEQPDVWRAANPKAVLRFARTDGGNTAERAQRTRPVAERRYVDAWGCALKGNYSYHGDMIYHLPGQRYYRQTCPEALFCTEREAMAAGFRRSKE